MGDTPPGDKLQPSIRSRWLVGMIAATGVLLGLVVLWKSLTFPETAEVLFERGQSALSRGNPELAEKSARRAVELSPRMASGWKLLAEALSRNNQLEQACDALEEYDRLRPDDGGQFAFRMGRDWMLRNRVGPASRALKLSEQADAHALESLKLQAQIAAVTGHARETSRCLMELLKRGSIARGELLLVTSAAPSIDDPVRLEAIRNADPDNPRPRLAEALHELNQNHYEQAEQILLRITAAHPDDVEAQGNLAELYAKFLPEKFLRWHAQLPLAMQDDSRIWLARGRWLSDTGRIEGAIRCLHEAIQREPEQLSATTLIGQLLKSVNETKLGSAFSERGHQLQRIVDFNVRMNEPRASEFVLPMIEELEATGRLWEAWGWCLLPDQVAKRDRQAISEIKKRIEPQLNVWLPRSLPQSLPGVDFDWNRFPLPDWAEFETTDRGSGPIATYPPSEIRFQDRAAEVGLDFRFANSYVPSEGRKIFETMGAGVAVLDFDGDGWSDLYFPQGNSTATTTSEGPSDCLYRNQHGERYVNVTSSTGIHETSYSQGVAAGDYDNDGFPDIYVANLGRNRLYRNNGDGTYTDATDEAGLQQSLWTVSCAIADLNGDGLPELFDVNYVQGKDLLTGYCTDSYGRRTVCRPTVYDPTTDTVAINLGDGRFLEQQSECGLDLPQGMGLGLVIADFNEDDRLDIFVANDMTANYLLINEQTDSNQPLHFRDEAILRSVALDENGFAQACMGVACADINRDSVPDLFVTNFAQESNTLYLSQPGGFFQDRTQAAGLRKPSFEPLGFGTQFLDADNDGWFDLAVANGHIDEFVNQPFRMKTQFFQGHPDGRFTELFAKEAGPLFDQLRLGRGMATLDWNRDGRVDFIVTDVEEPVLLAENQSMTKNRALRIRFIGTTSSRDAIGTKIRVSVTAGDERYFQIMAGDGYQSSIERTLCIGTGLCDHVERVSVKWPSGQVSRADHVAVDREWIVIEGLTEWQFRN